MSETQSELTPRPGWLGLKPLPRERVQEPGALHQREGSRLETQNLRPHRQGCAGHTGRHVNIPSAKAMAATAAAQTSRVRIRSASSPGSSHIREAPALATAFECLVSSQPVCCCPFNSHGAGTQGLWWAVLGRAAAPSCFWSLGRLSGLSGKNEASRRTGKWPAVTRTQGAREPQESGTPAPAPSRRASSRRAGHVPCRSRERRVRMSCFLCCCISHSVLPEGFYPPAQRRAIGTLRRQSGPCLSSGAQVS